ncbi:MAG TPA: ketopantoate reductase family protein [Spirochaetota bacterium]|jgi:2-dehydropantoate 2-reductase|nr:ketopantoate reductase family protein [Spirochaetota bacterium]HON15578.1 ketopantoate reductase family protein [Spirochaetota bacterium]HOV07580.1 ketopantoate reductase family protein [Spirochaetota bacterium]HRS61691.1 ketopantoate reductase family protein [Spirochaetota bacterium]HRU64443.1 ketopantoate reductase family protein [Spirochaetota bacterium]
MKKISSVFISGLGAIGALYASILYKFDRKSLFIIADKERIEKYKREKIKINNEEYDFNFVNPSESTQKADLILIAVKHYSLLESIRDIKNFVGENTIILSLLNGITSEEIISEYYGKENILRSFVVGTDAVREGTSIKFTNPGRIVFGSDRDSRDEKVWVVKEFFEQSGIPYVIPENIVREQWWKFMMNVAVNQVSAILRAPYGVFQQVDEAKELLRMASLEVLQIARRKGIELSEKDIDHHLEIIGSLAPSGKTSMLQDIEAGRKTEVEIFSGAVIELGRELGVPTPINNMLFNMIKTLEKTSVY